MRRRIVAVVIVFAALGSLPLRGEQATGARADEELKAHLETLGRKLDDPLTDLGTRERLALEMAATLDRAALGATSADVRRARWSEAAAVLERFLANNPDPPQQRTFQVQAGVYFWARARTWMQALEANPANTTARDKAVVDLNASLKRLEPVYASLGKENDVFAQNVRFRTAQALADLAAIGPFDPAERVKRTHAALVAIWDPVTEPSLLGYAHLLRGTLQLREGRHDEAKAEIEAAAKAKPAPAESELLDARVAVLVAKKDYSAALKAIDDSAVDANLKPGLRIHARLEERAGRPEGPERESAEKALFRELKALKASGRPEARTALVAAASALRVPGAAQEPDAYDLLAEGAIALGDPVRAAALENQGAERADTLAPARPEQAAELRLKAGAYLYQAEKFAEADAILTRVAEQPKAGAMRPRAGLLRALARGRALALDRQGSSQASYLAALDYQIKSFPDDPSTAEARWLLGKLRLAEGDQPGAATLWTAIPHGSPRWIDSRVEIAAIRQHELDTQRLNNDREAIAQRMVEARSFLDRCLLDSRGEIETNELLLASARLELTPGVGRPGEARRVLETIQRSIAGPAQRDTARRLDLVAMAQLNRWVEVEQAVRTEANSAEPAELVEIVRLLDRAAADAESDLKSRRIGLLLRILLSRMLERLDAIPAALRAEVRLRNARAQLFSGDEIAARRAMGSGSTQPSATDTDLLRDLADTYTRLAVYELAVEVHRLRSRRLPAGSLPWFDARYGLALAYYRSGKPREALHLIDATAILHPDLGGGELREKFIRLRQRINPND
jgi:hypothetical protein